MKVSKLSTLILLGLALAIPFTGCKKKPGYLTPLPGSRAGQVPEPESAGPITPGVKTEDVAAEGIKSNDPASHQGWNENAEMFKGDTVHFDYDSSVVKSSEKAKV